MNVEKLISQIQSLDGILKQEANKAVNRLLTIRNWLVGYYIVEYEQKGEDRARYGDNILGFLAESLAATGLSATNLKWNRLFYLSYPHIGQIAVNELENISMGIRQTVSDESGKTVMGIRQTLSDESTNTLISAVPTAISAYEIQLNEKIINRLSFSHIILLLPINDALKRTFYAVEAIKGTWSVRELKLKPSSSTN